MGKCKQPVETVSRVVGFFRPVQFWNPGKKEEFKDRKYFGLKGVKGGNTDKKEVPISRENNTYQERS
jgi:hypothetical protein